MRFRKIPHEPKATKCGFRASQDLPEAEAHVCAANRTGTPHLSLVNKVIDQARLADVDRHGYKHRSIDDLDGFD